MLYLSQGSKQIEMESQYSRKSFGQFRIQPLIKFGLFKPQVAKHYQSGKRKKHCGTNNFQQKIKNISKEKKIRAKKPTKANLEITVLVRPNKTIGQQTMKTNQLVCILHKIIFISSQLTNKMLSTALIRVGTTRKNNKCLTICLLLNIRQNIHKITDF